MPNSLRSHVDRERVVSDLEALAQFHEPDTPGWTRRVFSEAHASGRAWLRTTMEQSGLVVQVDRGGNLVGVRHGALPPDHPDAAPIVTGSHSDTVLGGGRFDGPLGVIGGIEVARTLQAGDVVLDRPLWVVDFLGEEPNPWGLSCIGSRAVSGGLGASDLARDDGRGTTLRTAISGAGFDPDAMLHAAWERRPHAFVELHIEQGPSLEVSRRSIGVVSSIVGVHRMTVIFGGQRDHAGTTPMQLRRDASVGAAELVLAVEAAGSATIGAETGVGTTGRLEVAPGAINVVPDHAAVWVELRSSSQAWISDRTARVTSAAREIATRRDLTCTVEVLSSEPPTAMDGRVMSVIADAASATGLSAMELPSGAEHDARQLDRIAGVGMIFVPSRGGRSHCPEEWTDPDEIAAGVQVLLGTIVRLDAHGAPAKARATDVADST